MTPRLVDACGTRRRLQALAVAGWSLTDLAPALGRSRQRVSLLRAHHGARVTADTAHDVTTLYTDLTHRAAPTGPSAARTSLIARRAGWLGPDAWAGVDVDDPGAQPNLEDAA